MRRFAVGDRMIVMVGYDHAGPDAHLAGASDRVRTAPAADRRADRAGSRRTSTGPTAPMTSRCGPASSGRAPGPTCSRTCTRRASTRSANGAASRHCSSGTRSRSRRWCPTSRRPTASDEAWTLMCWNGAHDSVCGCSHDQVAIDVDGRYARVRATCEEVVADALTALGAQVHGGAGVIRFNPSPFERDGVPPLGYAVTDDVPEPGEVPVAIEPIDGGVLADGVRDPVPRRTRRRRPLHVLSRRAGPACRRRRTRSRVDGQDIVAAWDGLESPDAGHQARGRAVPSAHRRDRQRSSRPSAAPARRARRAGHHLGRRLAVRARRAPARRRGQHDRSRLADLAGAPRRPGRVGRRAARGRDGVRGRGRRGARRDDAAVRGTDQRGGARDAPVARGSADPHARRADARRDRVRARDLALAAR